jgi:hypothetical protein
MTVGLQERCCFTSQSRRPLIIKSCGNEVRRSAESAVVKDAAKPEALRARKSPLWHCDDSRECRVGECPTAFLKLAASQVKDLERTLSVSSEPDAIQVEDATLSVAFPGAASDSNAFEFTICKHSVGLPAALVQMPGGFCTEAATLGYSSV